MEKEVPYKPVHCTFFDYFEHFATLRQRVTIRFIENGEEKILNEALIFDLPGGKAGEYVHIRKGEETFIIRADYILSINEINATDFDGSCGIN